MATISNTIRLQDKMSNTLNNIQRASNKTLSSFSSLRSGASSLFGALTKFSIVKNLFNMVTSQLDSAISRFDTLNNYTKVMSNLGISEDAANKSRERLSEGLKGLPTTLNDAVVSVQKFTSANGNVEASTEMYLALNNAILAGRCFNGYTINSNGTDVTSLCKR